MIGRRLLVNQMEESAARLAQDSSSALDASPILPSRPNRRQPFDPTPGFVLMSDQSWIDADGGHFRHS
jgi:hypothetical protein